MEKEKNSLWDIFETTGKVDDYLKYKAISDHTQGEDKNEYSSFGYNSKRDSYLDNGGW